MHNALASVLFVLALGSTVRSADDPFWIVRHGPLTATRLDSIINPGGVASHVHAILGGSNFGPEYNYKTSLDSECTTANVDIDHSNYWAPDMYRKTADGGVEHIGLSYANTYYFVRRQPNEVIHEFPPGFRMMAGSASRTTYNGDDRSNAAISYACLGVDSDETPDFPKQACPLGVRAQAFFPNCWDGKNNWLEGNKHVSYPAEGAHDGGGKCPDTHPNRIVSLFYEFIFHDDWEEGYKSGRRVLANGDDAGYSFHADFVNGWPEGTFKNILSYGSQCNVGFSLENCPALKSLMKEPGHCDYQGFIVDENIDGTLPNLPGNNPIWNGAGPRLDSGYTEKGLFVRVGDNSRKTTPPGPGKAFAQIDAGDIHIVTVGGDMGYTGPTLISGDGATNGVADMVSTTAKPAPSVTTMPTTSSGSSSTLAPVLIASGAGSTDSADISPSSARPRPTATKACHVRRSRQRL